jgi:hypothetical protein
MNLKDMLAKMSQLSEATEKTKTGVKHTAEPGGYGRKDDEDDEGNKVKSDAPKKGRGRPKKDADETGEVKKYDFSAFGVKHGKDVKLPAYDKKKTTKHSLKDWIETIDQNMLAEAGYTTAPMPGAVAVKDAAGKVVATAKNPQAAQAFEKVILLSVAANQWLKAVMNTLLRERLPAKILASQVRILLRLKSLLAVEKKASALLVQYWLSYAVRLMKLISLQIKMIWALA